MIEDVDVGYRKQRALLRARLISEARECGADRVPVLRGDEIAWADVSPEDFDELVEYDWTQTRAGYAKRAQRPADVLMHRQIMDAPDDMQVDHINRDRLDNRRSNLRLVTKGQQAQNMMFSDPGLSSRYRGVRRAKDRDSFYSYASCDGRQESGGTFADEEIAALRAQYLRANVFEIAEDDPQIEEALRSKYAYDSWPSGEPYNWAGAGRGDTRWDAIDYHVDLFCGTIKKGRIGVDRFPAPGVDVVMDLATFSVPVLRHPTWRTTKWAPIGRLPFADSSIVSIISHHGFEHLDQTGLISLMDETYRVLEPDGILRVIVPLFPSHSAVADPDHKSYLMLGTLDSFCGHLGDENNPTGCWLDSFSVPYTKCRYEKVHEDYTAPTTPDKQWTKDDVRELRVALKAIK